MAGVDDTVVEGKEVKVDNDEALSLVGSRAWTGTSGEAAEAAAAALIKESAGGRDVTD